MEVKAGTVKTYQVQAERERGWWTIYVPEIDYHTQASTIAEIDEMARDLIAVAEDVDPNTFELDVSLARPAIVARELEQAAALDSQGRDALSQAASARRRAANALRKDYGLSVKDTAAVLGVTRSRVYQLLNA